MRKHTVEIGDRNGQSMKIHISTGGVMDYDGSKQQIWTPLTRGNGNHIWGLIIADQIGPAGKWRTIDKGFIKYNNGTIVGRKSGKGDLTTSDLILMNLDGTWGMQLFEYEDIFGVNDDGTGFIVQPWIVNISMGKFSWTLLD